MTAGGYPFFQGFRFHIQFSVELKRRKTGDVHNLVCFLASAPKYCLDVVYVIQYDLITFTLRNQTSLSFDEIIVIVFVLKRMFRYILYSMIGYKSTL